MKLRICTAALSAMLILSGGAEAADRIAFGSTALKSVHYTYAAAATKAINDKSADKVQVTVISTGGAVDNLQRIARGQINMGLGTYATIYQAYKGIGKFKGKAMPKLRGLWVHSPALQAWVVRQDSGVKTVADLAGKKFTPGQRGSATEQLVIQMLEALKIKPDLYRATLSDAVAAVKDKRAIGYVKAGGTATLDGTTLELMAFTPVRLLSFSDAQVKKVKAKFPFINFQKYKDNQVDKFPAFSTPVQVVGEFATSDSLTDEQVIAILEGIVDNQKPQKDAFPSFAKLDVMRDSVNLIPIPLHAGAVKFYRSRGIKVPEELVPPEMK
ncbi:MAG: TAXI family TRAP transporter solute-binding subunit [Hyphomicrobiaceae bacterium]|nr:TAXI family TRAP transporter solute-binding subunit [Hyphomicrobiaceae bacterium]